MWLLTRGVLVGLVIRHGSRLLLSPQSSVLITSSCYWYLDGEGGAPALGALDGDGAVVVFDGLLDDGEAEAGARLLGREVRLEQFRDVVGRDAAARVGDLDARVAVAREEAHCQAPALAFHRLHAVNDKVCE